MLSVEVTIFVSLAPECETVNTELGDLCVVPGYGGSASALVDPYVYIDPDWPYASWFEVQTTSDDANTTWVAVKRTPIDPSAFGIEADGEPMDGGVPDGGTGGDGSVDMDAGAGGSMDPGVQGTGNGGGGCSVGPRQSAAPACLAFLVVAAAIARRRRRLRRTNGKGAKNDES